MNARIYRDIDALKIWGNDYGMRFLRDPDDKTKYKVYFTDVDIDKLESFVRQQQAEMDIVIKLLCGEQISDDLMMHWNPLHSTLKSKLLKAQEK
jgi:transcription antitermination factor NusA-like protein